jgi:hypothetical protein
MSSTHTSQTFISASATDISEFVNTHNYEVNPTIHQTVGYGKTWDESKGGLKKGTWSMGGIYDDDAAGPSAILRPLYGTTGVIIYGPEGNQTGDPKLTFSVVYGKYNETGKVDDMVAWSQDSTITGAVVETTWA